MKYKKSLIIILFFFITSTAHIVNGQHLIKETVDFFTIKVNKKRFQRDSTLYPAKLILAPIISYSPETSLAFGVGSKFLFKVKGSGTETRTSNMPISISYTLKNQIIVFSGFEIFSPGEQWMLTGNIGFKQFPRLYYGIGRNTPEENEEPFESSQLLFEPILLKQTFFRYLFLGAGYRYNKISKAEFKEGGLLETENYPGSLGSTSSGIQLAAVYDSRSNLLNAKKGIYMELTHGFYGGYLGGSHDFQLTRLDFRKYTQPFKKRDDVIAYQFIAHFSHGTPPLSELALFGSSRMMRGYYEGRFIERNMLAAQVEYRRNIYKRLGGVLFLGLGDVAHEISDFKFNNLRLSAGFGLRFLLEKKEQLNVRMDFGFGRKTNNYYLNIAEAF